MAIVAVKGIVIVVKNVAIEEVVPEKESDDNKGDGGVYRGRKR